MGALLSFAAQLVFLPRRVSFVLFTYFRWFVNWSLGYTPKSERSITDKAMGDKSSRSSNEYDSTWEDECDQEVQSSETSSRTFVSNNSVSTYSVFNSGYSSSGYSSAQRTKYAAEDMKTFRCTFRDVQCDDTADDEKLNQMYAEENKKFPNLQFYHNKIKSRPDGVYIDEFHSEWFGDYKSLEWVHSYIQWLFPIQEPGMNYDAHVLTTDEIKLFRKDEEAKERLLKSYKLMLDFYGIELLDEETGEVCRAENWEERFRNLNRNTHNNLRITRILKCLGILGFEHYQAPLVRFFLEETLVNGKLPNVKWSVLNYFMFAVLDRSKRKELIRYAFENFEPKEEFVWCPPRIRRRFKKEITSRKVETDQSVTRPRHKQVSNAKRKETHLQTELESQIDSTNNVAETGDANGNSAGSITDHNNEPEVCKEKQAESILNPSDVTTGNKNVSDSDKVSEETPDQMRSSNTSQDAFRDSGKIPPTQDCVNIAVDVSAIKNDAEVPKYTEQSEETSVSLSSDETSHDHPISIAIAVDEIQEKDSGGCNHTEPGNENVSGGADTQKKPSECSTTIDEEMFEVSNEEETITEEEEPGIYNIPPDATGDSGKIPPIQNSDNNAVDLSAVKNDTEGHKHTGQSEQSPVSVSSNLANQEPVSDGNNRNERQDQETSQHHPTSVTKAVDTIQEKDSGGCNHTDPDNENISGGDTEEKRSELSHEEGILKEKKEPGISNTGDSGKMSPAIQNSGSEENMDIDPPKEEHTATEESAVNDMGTQSAATDSGSVTSDVHMCDVSNGQAVDSEKGSAVQSNDINTSTPMTVDP